MISNTDSFINLPMYRVGMNKKLKFVVCRICKEFMYYADKIPKDCRCEECKEVKT